MCKGQVRIYVTSLYTILDCTSLFYSQVSILHTIIAIHIPADVILFLSNWQTKKYGSSTIYIVDIETTIN